MEKILEYKLNININENLPQMPPLHDYKVDEIKIENGTLIIVSNDVANHDDNSSDFVGFDANRVRVEFCFDGCVSRDCGDKCNAVNCNVIVSQHSPKKQIKEKNKYGYGQRSNCYDIREFISFYKDYNLNILHRHGLF